LSIPGHSYRASEQSAARLCAGNRAQVEREKREKERAHILYYIAYRCENRENTDVFPLRERALLAAGSFLLDNNRNSTGHERKKKGKRKNEKREKETRTPARILFSPWNAKTFGNGLRVAAVQACVSILTSRGAEARALDRVCRISVTQLRPRNAIDASQSDVISQPGRSFERSSRRSSLRAAGPSNRTIIDAMNRPSFR